MILYFEQMFEAFQDIRTNKHLAYVSVSHRKKRKIINKKIFSRKIFLILQNIFFIFLLRKVS
jgi:hypothetical protein